MKLEKVSYSSLSSYDSCPQKYFFSYVRKIWPEKKAKALCVGGATHAVLAEFYRKRLNKQILQLSEAREIFRVSLLKDPIEFKKNETLESILEENEGVIQVILDNPLNIEPKEIECWFSVEFKNPLTGETLGLKLNGIIDLTSIENEVIEHKTSSRKYKPEDILKSYQHIGYFVGFYNKFHVAPTKILYNVIYKTKKPVIDVFEVKITPADVKKYFEWASDIIKKIESEVWTAKPSYDACKWCDYKAICQHYKGKL